MTNYKYLKIKDWLLEGINNNTFKYGEKLPSEKALMNRFSVSRQTVRNAIDVLEKEGDIKRVKGSGMFVNKNLKDIRNKTVGVLLSYFDEYVFPFIVGSIQSELTDRGYSIDLGITYNKLDLEKKYLERMLDSNFSGLIVEGTKTGLPNPNLYLYEELYKRNVPVVFIHNYYPALHYPSVLMDDVRLSCKLTEMLIENGHRNIAGLFKFDDLQGHRRYEGYVKALTEANIPINEDNIGWFSTSSRDSMFVYQDKPILKNIQKCSAVVCYNDQLATRLYSYFRENGINVPNDISVVGFDNLFPEYFNSKFTSANHPKGEIGKEAVKILFNMIEEGMDSYIDKKIVIETNIVLRNSVKKVND